MASKAETNFPVGAIKHTLTFTPAALSLTEGDAAGQSGALSLPSARTVALHHAVVQQMSRPRVGKRGTFELHCVHFVNEAAAKTQRC